MKLTENFDSFSDIQALVTLILALAEHVTESNPFILECMREGSAAIDKFLFSDGLTDMDITDIKATRAKLKSVIESL